jgi:hypothetical protein
VSAGLGLDAGTEVVDQQHRHVAWVVDAAADDDRRWVVPHGVGESLLRGAGHDAARAVRRAHAGKGRVTRGEASQA